MGWSADHSRAESSGEYMLASMSENSAKNSVSVTVEEQTKRHHVHSLRRPASELVLDFVLALVPLLFVALAIAAKCVDGKPKSDTGDRIMESLILGPTVFPIAFAALCGHLMKSLALYKSQTGIRMKHLEHLVGAQSIFSSLQRLFFLRNYSVVGLVITLTWCLSPLGGQAFIRLLKEEPSTTYHDESIMYLGPDSLEVLNVDGDFSLAAGQLPIVTGLYLSSLTAPSSVRDSTRDLWNNVKIPSLSESNGPLTNVFVNIKSDVSGQRSSLNLVGIPIGNLSDIYESLFEVDSISLNVTCVSNAQTTLSAFANNPPESLYNGNYTERIVNIGPTNTSIGWQKYYGSPSLQAGFSTSLLYASNRSVENFIANNSETLTIFYGSKEKNNNDNRTAIEAMSLATCVILPVRLRSKIECIGKLCEVTAFRKLATNLTEIKQGNLVNLLTNGAFPGIANGDGSSLSPTSLFLIDPETVLGVNSEYTPAPLWNVSLNALSERMSMALNTYYYVTSTTAFATNFDKYVQDKNAYWATTFAQYIAAGDATPPAVAGLLNITARARPLANLYTIKEPWFPLALIISIILVVIAACNIALRWVTEVPDVFGYVSSMTLHNELCDEQGLARSSALDGLERAVELRDVMFRIADIRSEGEVGRMAFVPVNVVPENQHYGQVKIGRLYD